MDTEQWREDGDRLASAEMTLRDYFAAKALQGMLAHPECDYTPLVTSRLPQSVADAYALADAMLLERAKP